MSDSFNFPAVMALGYFDCVHKGHKMVIESALSTAKERGAKLVVLTFSGNLRASLSGGEERAVYTLEERVKILKDLGADEVFVAPVNKTFLSMGKLAFLNLINKKYNILGYTCGEDYRFGKGGLGDIEYLKNYANSRAQSVEIIPDVLYNGQKISTTAIKELLKNGDIAGVNQRLSKNYSISGIVFGDRKVGSKLGFPTVNIKPAREKLKLKQGVYAGHITIDGKKYKAMINYGSRPTFGLDESLLEAHVIGFSGELYGRELTVYFDKFLRDIKKFSSKEELKKQLEKDLEGVKNAIND